MGQRRVGRVGPRRVGPRRVSPPKVGGPTFRAFFHSPATISLFLCLFGGLLVEFWWCLKRRSPEMCTFGVLGLETPAARNRSDDSPRAQTCTFDRPGLHNNHQDFRRPMCAFGVLGLSCEAPAAPKQGMGPQDSYHVLIYLAPCNRPFPSAQPTTVRRAHLRLRVRVKM